MKNKKIFFIITGMCLLGLARAEMSNVSNQKKVAAIDSQTGAPVYTKSLLQTKSNSKKYIDSENLQIELAPHSVAELQEDRSFRLLRGSAYGDTKKERSISTPATKFDLVGKMIFSYDYREKSSSGFVLQGQTRMLNPHQADHSAILDKNQGATMVVGDIYPTAVRGLDYKKATDWLAGYGWTQEQRSSFLSDFPAPGVASRKPALEASSPESLAQREGDPIFTKEQALIPSSTKLEDYFAGIETGEEKPHYYEDKLSMDVKVGDDELKKNQKVGRLDPEDAALIPLPNVRIDTDMPTLSVVSTEEQKIYEEKETAPLLVKKVEKKASRKIASVSIVAKKSNAVAKNSDVDPEIASTLERLRRVKEDASFKRGPASMSSPIPDPVYDFSENF